MVWRGIPPEVLRNIKNISLKNITEYPEIATNPHSMRIYD
jgi:hypothetical protein